jgi:hypothetical protein
MSAYSLSDTDLFAYCGNNPVKYIDSQGRFFFTAIGAITGFVSSAFVATLMGTDPIDAGINGAIGGAIAGAGVDVALLILGTTAGAGAAFAAATVAYLAGGVGNATTTALSTTGPVDKVQLAYSFVWGATFNLLSFGTSLECAAPSLSKIASNGMMSLYSGTGTGTLIGVSTGLATERGLQQLNTPIVKTTSRAIGSTSPVKSSSSTKGISKYGTFTGRAGTLGNQMARL